MPGSIHNEVLNYVRKGHSANLCTAEAYLLSLAESIGKNAAAVLFGAKSYTHARKRSRSTLTIHRPDWEFKSLGSDGEVEIPAAAIAVVDAIASNVEKDLDGDVVRSDGLIFDQRGPLLRGHEPNSPFGRFMGVLTQSEKSVTCRYAVADTGLGRDSLALMRIGALRKSIGFRVLEATPLGFKDTPAGRVPTGFDIKKALVLETSAVAIPANPTAAVLQVHEKAYDAARSLASKGFEDPVMKVWGKALLDSRAVVVKGATLGSEEGTAGAAGESVAPAGAEPAAAVQKQAEPVAADKQAAVDASKGLSWGMEDEMSGSYEQAIGAIDRNVKRYLCSQDSDCDQDSYAMVMATFPTQAIVCMTKWERGERERKCYRVNYSLDSEGKVSFTGYERVKVEAAVIAATEEKSLKLAERAGLVTKDASPINESTAEPVQDSVDDLKRLLAKAATGEIAAEGLADFMAQTAELLETTARASELRRFVSAGV